MRKTLYFVAGLLACASVASAQEGQDDNKVTVSGSIQSDMLIGQEDAAIGAAKPEEWLLTNTYADVNLMSKNVDAGLRFEFNRFPLPGFEKDFKGYGVPYFYLKGKFKGAEITLGSFYEQFGSGFILRNYEERSLGIDNHLLGARIVLNPVKGVRLKALTGEQRRYWAHNGSWISGVDLELSVDEWFSRMHESNTFLTLGASFVNKYEEEETDNIMADMTHKLRLPQNVNAYDFRVRFQKGGFNLLGEYAFKTEDPSFDNGYIYRTGNVAMLSASYSRRGLSFLAQAKRSDDMSFRSRRSMTGTSSFLNHLPAFTQDQTYSLAAMYPYATNSGGEWAYQAQVGYTFKRKTFLGGKYGMNLKVNYSYVTGIDKNMHVLPETGGTIGSSGYGSAFWKWGDEMYYQDINVQMERRMSKNFKLNLMFMNQFYNQTVVEGHGGMVHSNIYVADGRYTFSPKFVLRAEAQYLTTGEDQGDWVFGLLEASLFSRLMITLSDQYNAGETNEHYYQGLITGTLGSHRLAVGYGRTRAGFNCSGGVCRYVPATKGVTISYNYNF